MTDETDSPAPKKPGRPRKAASPAVEPVDESKTDSGPVPPELPTITVEELVEGMDSILVRRMFLHLTSDLHRLTPGEARIQLGYGLEGRNADMDAQWNRIVGS